MTQPSPAQQQLMALSGIVQACHLVDQIARTGQADPAALNACLLSLFNFDPESTEQVYGGLVSLRPGLQTLANLLGNHAHQDHRNVLRYALGVIHLERRLARRPDLQSILHSRLRHAERNMEHFSREISEITANISAIYQDTLSTFKYRIQVTGSYQQLQQPGNAERIRALLLAGVRSAVLWHQLGGRRWQLILRRRHLLQGTRVLLSH